MPREPLLKVPVHDYIRSYLCELYENDFIFDKFRCSFSYDGKLLFTGSYDNKVVVRWSVLFFVRYLMELPSAVIL
jgi:hypothetical protein